MMKGEKNGSAAVMAEVSKVFSLDVSAFEEKVEKTKITALVFFTASECRPCKLMESELTELEKDFSGKVSFFRVNTDDDVELASRHSVVSTPTLILFIDGKAVMRLLGYVTRTDIARNINERLRAQ